MPHILIVCTANICRSPVVEAVLRDRLKQKGLAGWKVSSAGTWAQPGLAASRFSVQLLAEQGLDLEGHRSRLVGEDDLAFTDLILTMEAGHAEALRVEFPTYAAKVYMLSEMIGQRYDIADPYGGPIEGYEVMIREVTALIEAGLARIMELARTNARRHTARSVNS